MPFNPILWGGRGWQKKLRKNYQGIRITYFHQKNMEKSDFVNLGHIRLKSRWRHQKSYFKSNFSPINLKILNKIYILAKFHAVFKVAISLL